MRRKIIPVIALCLLLSSCAEDRYHAGGNGGSSYYSDPNFCNQTAAVCPVLIGAAIVGAALLVSTGHH